MKRNCLMMVLLAVSTMLMAAPISLKQAQQRAYAFAREKGHIITTPQPHRALRRAKAQTAEVANPYYIFDMDDQNGFVIISGDDRTPEVLGYTEEGEFNEQEMPDALRYWLDFYADEIEHLDDRKVTAPQQEEPKRAYLADYSDNRPVVKPLLKTTWNQGTPYNNQCPLVDGQTVPCGCIATAMAQVMFYHKWPARTTKIPGYTWRYNDEIYALPELPELDIEWNKMRNSYSGSETTETAMSTFMFYVAQAVKMGFTPSGSGSNGGAAKDALRKYFDYEVYYYERNRFTIEEWENMVVSELAIGNPVFYGGSTTSGGHAFVCDGINADGLFHINWGWGGGSNGYFRLSILNPGDNTGYGAAATKDGYSMGQDIIIGWHHASEMENPNQDPIMMKFNNMALNDNKLTYNAWSTASVDMGYDIVLASLEEDGSLISRYTQTTNGSKLSPGWGWVNQSIDISSIRLPEGTYHLYLASRKGGSKLDWQVWDWHRYLEATFNASKRLTDCILHPVIDVEKVEFVFPGDNLVYEQQRADITIYNRGDEINTEVQIFVSTDEQNPGESQMRTGLYVPQDGVETIAMWFEPQHTGTTYVWLALDGECKNIIAQTSYEVGGKERLHTDCGVATFYASKNFKGLAISLPVGDYKLTQLADWGIRDNDIESIEILPGYRVVCYDSGALVGTYKRFDRTQDALGSDWSNKISSIRVQPVGTSGYDGTYLIQSANNSLCWDTYNNKTEGGYLQQRRYTSSRRSFIFEVKNIGRGFYTIQNHDSEMFMTVKDGGTEKGTRIHQLPRDPENEAQEFLIVKNSEGSCQIISRATGKVIESPSNSTGAILSIADNEQQEASYWKLVEKADAVKSLTEDSKTETNDIYYDLGGHRISKPQKGIYVLKGKKVVIK